MCLPTGGVHNKAYNNNIKKKIIITYYILLTIAEKVTTQLYIPEPGVQLVFLAVPRNLYT